MPRLSANTYKRLGIDVITQPIRGCGKRKEGGMYLRSAETSSDGFAPVNVLLRPPIPTERRPHRTAVIVNGTAVLEERAEEQWLVGASAARVEKERGDAWANQLFGMTVTRRLSEGECAHCKTAEEALETLVERIMWDEKVLEQLRKLTLTGVQDLPHAAAPFTKIVAGIQQAAMTRDVQALVAVAAGVWSLAEALQPRHRATVVRDLAAMLTRIGLRRDAVALLVRYPASS